MNTENSTQPNPSPNPELVPVPGNTYPVRAELKALGATWDGAGKTWRVPPEKLAAARALVEGQHAAPPQSLGAARQEALRNAGADLDALDDPFEKEAEGPKLVPLYGNTYPVKDALKAIGARWDGDRRAWMIREEKAEYARAIIAEGGAGTGG